MVEKHNNEKNFCLFLNSTLETEPKISVQWRHSKNQSMTVTKNDPTSDISVIHSMKPHLRTKIVP